jgi:hypothetical protein
MPLSSLGSSLSSAANALGSSTSSGGLNTGSLIAAGLGGVAGLLGGGASQKPTGYQGKVPVYSAIREQVPMNEQDPARRPGSGGRQYFTNTQFLPRTDESGISAALLSAQQQADAIAQANTALTQGERTALLNAAQSLFPTYSPYAGGSSPYDMAQGGIVGLARGGSTGEPRFLAGGTDGMADKIPATIEDDQPAKLGHGEFVIPSDCVSFLGSGNSEAGANVLYDMMDRIRKHAHGSTKQIKKANLKKVLPI